MRSMQSVFLCLLVFIMTATATASDLDDGGMSGGGGGGTSPGRPITEDEVVKILSQARLEVYMALALKDQNGGFPWFELFTGKDNIYTLLLRYQIYGSKVDCHDSFGNSTDGSIHSPIPNTICISVKNLSSKLTIDNARAQILALVAHEYSHLKGFDEAAASALQTALTSVFANSSSDQAFNLLDYMNRQSFNLGDSISNYNNKPKTDLSWDYLCFVAEKMETALIIVEQQFTDKPFTISPRELYEKQNSYLIKQRAIKTQVCANSQFHPQKQYYQRDVQKWFDKKNTLLDQDLADEFLLTAEYDVRNNPAILGTVTIGKINNFADFDREFKDVEKYLYDDFRYHLTRLSDLAFGIIE